MRGCARTASAGPCPRSTITSPIEIADELAEMMGFDVEGEGDGARFLITQEGSRLATTYGNEHIDPDKRINRYLDDAIGPAALRAAWFPATALAWPASGRSIRLRWCRMRMARKSPMSGCCCRSASAGAVEQIVGSYKAISIEGGFKIIEPDGNPAQGRARHRRQGSDRSRYRPRPGRPPRVGRIVELN